MKQQKFIAAAVDVLNTTKKDLATKIDVLPRTFYNWSLSSTSSERRDLREHARQKIESLVAKADNATELNDWLGTAEAMREPLSTRDYVRLRWKSMVELNEGFIEVESKAIALYALPLAAWLADSNASADLGRALRHGAAQLKMVDARSRLFRNPVVQIAILKRLPLPAGEHEHYADVTDLLLRFRNKLTSMEKK